MSSPSCIVGIGGTTRAGSSSERLVRCVLSEAEMLGADTRLFGGEALSTLPHYAPENSARSPEQLDLLGALRQADGVVIGTPAYHGGVSGPKYLYETNAFHPRAPNWTQYGGERSWFNKPKKGNGENFAGSHSPIIKSRMLSVVPSGGRSPYISILLISLHGNEDSPFRS